MDSFPECTNFSNSLLSADHSTLLTKAFSWPVWPDTLGFLLSFSFFFVSFSPPLKAAIDYGSALCPFSLLLIYSHGNIKGHVHVVNTQMHVSVQGSLWCAFCHPVNILFLTVEYLSIHTKASAFSISKERFFLAAHFMIMLSRSVVSWLFETHSL